MADIIAIFSRWAKSGLSAMFSQDASSSLDGFPSSSMEPTRSSAVHDFQRIIRMLPRIEAVLGDAEEREIQDRSVNLWLSELRNLAYDIDDVVDEYEYKVLTARKKATAAEKACHRVKRKRGDDEHHDEKNRQREGRDILASSSSQVPVISDGMAEKIREIRKRFDEIERDRKTLRLREEDGARRSVDAYRPRPTSSLVDESNVVGRGSDKERIMELLLSDSESSNNIRVSNKITVIPIVGMGGVGKTTLAQIIYSDPKIHHHFDLRTWIHVSQDFDLMRITKEIYRSITKKSCKEDVGFDYLQDSIKKELLELQQRMFLVLDDVWNEEQCLWESLQAPLHGANTVKILITTRNKKVADVMRTMNSCNLGFLSREEGWRLFRQHALCDDEHLMEIGKRIVRKCGGLPLAIKLLGSHLRFEGDEDKWLSILDSELWDLDPGTNEILPALRLSYQRMPIHLKPCFRYCSMFRKNEAIEKNRLVWLWMAQGYIQPKIAGKTVEETGKEYFDELFGRSFFQVANLHKNSFVMHDLIFDLAVFISVKEFTAIKLDDDKQNNCISDNVRHLVIHDQRENNEAPEGNLVHPFLSEHATLRSIFYHGNWKSDNFQLPDSIRLRALLIRPCSSRVLFGSMDSLKHLRYLSISTQNYYIYFVKVNLSSLFNLFHSFCNLQVLDLSDCSGPIKSPRKINNLINLRHLILPSGSFMPCGIGKLTSLQTLKDVIVNDRKHKSGELGDIEELASLTGSCRIRGIAYATDVEGVKKANINRKKHIWRLCLNWTCMDECRNDDKLSFDISICFAANIIVGSRELTEALLEVLQPHKNLKELEIYYYPGVRFPLWLGDPSYSNLRVITLKGFHEWDGSCRVHLPCLQSMSIIDCAKLKNIKIVQSSSLKTLLVEDCHELTTLQGLCSLNRLESLKMIRCYNILISSEKRLPSNLQSVCFEECWKLTSLAGLQNLHSLKELKLIKCQKLQLSLEEQLSTRPGVVKIIDCLGLREWCQRYGFKFIQKLSNIKELTIYHSNKIISNYGSGNLVSLQTLHIYNTEESAFPKDEWIPCNLYTLHLNSCQRLESFPSYKNLSAVRLLKIWCCRILTYLPGLQMMKSLEKLEIIECPQFMLSPVQRLPSNLQFLLISDCPSLLWLPGLQQLFSLKDLRLYGCLQLMLPPLEQLPFMLHAKLEISYCPKLRDWCRRYNLNYNMKESPKALSARSSQQIKLWLEEASELPENVCVLDYDEYFLDTEKWPAFRVLGLYISSCVHLKSIWFGDNFTRFKQLRIWNCSHLEWLDCLCGLTSLQDMDISNCPSLRSLIFPNSLQSLAIDGCDGIYSLDFSKSLQSLVIDGCNRIVSLDCYGTDLSSLEISSCSTLQYMRGLRECQASLRSLKISNCPKLYLDDESLSDVLHPNNVEISACPHLQEWCQKHHIAYFQG